MPTLATRSVANRSKLITKSTFSGYDACLNPYVGCEFGCSYCYVRFFIKDPDKDWGEFVRVREHVKDKLPKEIQAGEFKFDNGSVTTTDPETGESKKKRLKKVVAVNDYRLVIGTMTDPYQPAEKKYRITRSALETITREDLPQFQKVGIFTRSPLVLRDIDLIKKLPRARVHFTVTPFPPTVMRAIEPYSPITKSRWAVVRKLKEAGLRVHVNISPVMPQLSESFIPEFTEMLSKLKVDEYFVDPMQPYSDSFDAFKRSCDGLEGVDWKAIESTMLDKTKYLEWKDAFHKAWDEERLKTAHLVPDQLPIWSDHEHKTWVDMRTGEQMSKRVYGDDL